MDTGEEELVPEHEAQLLPQRIVVIGVSGAGKTTLAREISRRLGLPHVELDALHWEPNWIETPLPDFRRKAQAALDVEQWVADGNYSRIRDVIWPRADALVWLDYPLPLVMYRLVKRTLVRALIREELYNGNREVLWEHLFTRKSLWLFALHAHGRYRRQFPGLFARPEYQHLAIVRLRSPRATRAWLSALDGERSRSVPKRPEDQIYDPNNL